MSDEFIKKALGMSSEPAQDDPKPVVVYKTGAVEPVQEEIDRDIDFARENYIDLIAKGADAIDELLAIAKQSQHPRAFEVVANLLKTTSDLNSDLVALHKKRQDLNKEKPAAAANSGETVNNNLFVGSTAELHKLIEQMKNNGKAPE